MIPIAWYDPTNGMVSTDKDSPLFTPLGQVLPLYPEGKWVGLTEEEINACDPSEECWGLHKIARAIEQRLKEKNA